MALILTRKDGAKEPVTRQDDGLEDEIAAMWAVLDTGVPKEMHTFTVTGPLSANEAIRVREFLAGFGLSVSEGQPASPAASKPALPPATEKLWQHLKASGLAVDAKTLAAETGLPYDSTRTYLSQLVRAGLLIRSHSTRQHRGRELPVTLFRVA